MVGVKKGGLRRARALLAVVLVLPLVGAALLPVSAQSNDGYVDIGVGDAHYDNVVFLGERGVLEGTDCGEGRFCPGEAISRRTLAVWLVRVLDSGVVPTRPDVSPFADVEVTEAEAGFIARLAELGVTAGCAVGPLRFCPDETVTRGQMASFLVRAFDLPGADPAGFDDVSVGNVHGGSIDRLAGAGITAGCDTDPPRFCPDRRTTRGQMASFLARAMRWVGSESVGLDPFVTPSLSGLDLERLAEAVATLDPEAECPEVELPVSYDDVVEVARIDEGCAFVEYVPLDGRTVEEVQAEFVSDPTVFAVSLPVTGIVSDTSQAFDFDDPSLEQWHLPHLAADVLWSGWPSGSRVTVAVIDDGVDGGHRDLSGKLSWWGRSCHRDPLGDHGTHVAGIVAAEQGNNQDVAGVAPKAEILPIKVHFSEYFDSNGNPEDSTCYGIAPSLTQAVNLARVSGADVINMSVRWSKEADYSVIRKQKGLIQALAAFLIGVDTLEWAIRVATMQNVVVVAAAGNCGDNTQSTYMGVYDHGWKHNNCHAHNQDQFPASYPDVIAVAATDSDRNRAVFSTSNSAVAIAAPGSAILSTVPAYTAGPDDPCPSDSTCHVQVESGTSMAAPVVSAVVAHMKARYPQATVAQITKALFTTADDKGQGKTDDLGHGIVNPAAAIRELHRLITGITLPEMIPAVGDEQELEVPTATTTDTPYHVVWRDWTSGPLYELWTARADGTGRVKLDDAIFLSWSPDRKRIAWLGRQGITVSRPDGTSQVNLGSNIVHASRPAWSPDSKRFAWVARNYTLRKPEKELWVGQVDGMSSVKVASEVGDFHGWSPDGEHLAWSVIIRGYGFTRDKVGRVDHKGQVMEVLPSLQGSFLGWSADGKHFADSFRSYFIDYIVVTHVDGKNQLEFADVTSFIGFSPDRKHLAWTAQPDTGPGNVLWVASSDGKDQVKFDLGVRLSVPDLAWSPDGKHIAWTVTTDTGQQLWAGRVDGTSLVKVADDGRFPTGWFWSPDGKHIAWTVPTDTGLQLWVDEIGGTGLGRLTVQIAHDGGFVGWSPNGKHIAWTVTTDTGQQLWVGGADGTSRVKIADITRLPNLFLLPQGPFWSPDGKHVAWNFRSDFTREQLWVGSVDGTRRVKVAEGRFASIDGWSPDSKHIAWTVLTDMGRELWISDADGTDRVKIAADLGLLGSFVGWSSV